MARQRRVIRGRQSAMVKRERIWVAFNTQAVFAFGAVVTGATYVSLFGPIEWTYQLGGSQSCTLMGLIYSLSWDSVAGGHTCRYAITIDEFSSVPPLTARPGEFTFLDLHDVLHEGCVNGTPAGGLTAFPYMIASSSSVGEGMIRVKARRILQNTQCVNLWIPSLPQVASPGAVQICGKALILRHG